MEAKLTWSQRRSDPARLREARRILVIGSGGAGKTVLANELGRLLSIPVTHLDELLYDPDLTLTAGDEFRRRLRSVVGQPSWIVEGTYPPTLPTRLAAADTVVLLDLSPLTCLAGVVRRRLRHGRGYHGGGVFGTASPPFLRQVWTYRRRVMPVVMDALAGHGRHADLIRLTRRSHVRRLLTDVRRDQPDHQSEDHQSEASGGLRAVLPRSGDHPEAGDDRRLDRDHGIRVEADPRT